VGRAAEDLLQPFGMRIPSTQLLDHVVPDGLQNFHLADLFPDFAGLRLDHLFSGIRMPELGNNSIKVTQGIDQQTKRAWMRTVADVPLEEPATLFSFGPVTVRIVTARFYAEAQVDVGTSGGVRHKMSGSISGDWEVQIGELKLVTFRRSALTFDENGRLGFSLSPPNIELSGAIQFLADIVKAAGNSDQRFQHQTGRDRWASAWDSGHSGSSLA